MRVMFDTSVLVASMVDPHPMHDRALAWHGRMARHRQGFLVTSHTLAEIYSVLTTLPIRPRIDPFLAQRMIDENILSKATVVALTVLDYRSVLDQASRLGLSGGIVYDALVARAARKSRADRLVTLNPGHFRRVWPDCGGRIVEP